MNGNLLHAKSDTEIGVKNFRALKPRTAVTILRILKRPRSFSIFFFSNKNISQGKLALGLNSAFEIDLQYLLVLVTAHAITCIFVVANLYQVVM